MKRVLLHNGRLSGKRLAQSLEYASTSKPTSHHPDILVRFGNSKGEEGQDVTINPKSAVARTGTKALSDHLKLHRLAMVNPAAVSGRTALVYVVDGQVIGMKSEAALSLTERERAGGVAVRALYLSGLDFGAVRVSTSVRGRPQVTQVLSAPPLSKEMSKLFADRIKELIARRLRSQGNSSGDATKEGIPAEERAHQLLVGADPEFMLRSSKSGKMVPASRFFLKEGKIGCDQRKAIGELRPSPRSTARGLTRSIGELIRNLNSKLRNKSVNVIAGSQPFKQFPIGGHIHFGGIHLSNNIIRALDTYLMIPLFLIERSKTSVQRRRYYGYLADVRPKGPRRFEYRAPGSWLVSPEVTLAAISLAKLVVENADQLRFDAFASKDAARAYYAGHKAFFYPLIPHLRRDLQLLPSYTASVEEDLRPLWEMIEQQEEWEENVDLRKVWSSFGYAQDLDVT